MDREEGERVGGRRGWHSLIRFKKLVALHHLYRHMPASGRSQASVARQQWSVESLGQGDIDGIVSRKIAPQFPDARQQDIVRISAQGKIREVGNGVKPSRRIHLTRERVSANDLRNLDVEEMRGMQCLPRREQARVHNRRRRRSQKNFQ